MSHVSMGDMTFATKLRTLVMQLAGEAIDKMRPRPRYGVVYTIDRPGKHAQVILNGDLDPVSVSLGAIQPKMAGQVVRVEGIGFDKYVTDVIGGVIYWGNVEIDASQVTMGTFAIARVPHLSRGGSTGRAYFSTDTSGALGSAASYLAMSPPADSPSNLMWLVTGGTTVWAIDKSGKLVSGSIPAELVNSGVFDAARIPAQSWASVTGKPSTFTPSSHSHSASDINSGVFDAARIPAQSWSSVTGKPSTFPPSSHSHSASDVNSGTFNIARIPHITVDTSRAYFSTAASGGAGSNDTYFGLARKDSTATSNVLWFVDATGTRLLISTDGNGVHYFQARDAGSRTTTAAANTNVGTNGTFMRSTSVRQAKVAIEDAPAGWIESVWRLAPRTWFDRSDAESLAAALVREADGEGVDWDSEQISPLRRIPGFVAEEVEEAGLEEFLVRDETGALTGLAYDRFSAALLVAMKDEREKRIAAEARVDALETAVASLESRLDALATHLDIDL